MSRQTLPGSGPLLACLLALYALHAPSATASETASPFRLGPQDAIWVASTLGLQAWAQTRYFDMEPARPSELDRGDLAPLDRWAAGNYSEAAALASDALLFPAIAAPIALSAWQSREAPPGGRFSGAMTETLVYMEALALSSALNLLMRSMRVHPRPLVYGSDAPASEKRKGEASGSFYSGHANGAFLAASYVGYTYPLRHPGFEHAAWLRAGAFGYAALVAGLRVSAGKHFPSDILAGAAAGTAFGWLFPRLHLRPVPGAPGRPPGFLDRLEGGILPRGEGFHAVLACRI